MIENVIKDVLMKNEEAKKICEDTIDAPKVTVKVFRLRQSLDDPTLLFWRPNDIRKTEKGQEWPFIFFMKLDEGKLLTNSALGTPIQKIDLSKVRVAITGLEIANS